MKVWELKKGDKWNTGKEILTFSKMDGSYGHWLNEDNELRIGHQDHYTKNDDGIYT